MVISYNSVCVIIVHYCNKKMAAPAEVSKIRSNFRIRQFKEKRHFNIAANLTLDTMLSFVILLIARTARIVCRQTHTHTHTHETTTVTFAAHARRGLITIITVCARSLTWPEGGISMHCLSEVLFSRKVVYIICSMT